MQDAIKAALSQGIEGSADEEGSAMASSGGSCSDKENPDSAATPEVKVRDQLVKKRTVTMTSLSQ